MQADVGSILGSKATAAAAIIFFQNWLKQRPWFPLLTYNSKRMNHYFSIALTGLATLGIHISWNAGEHSLLITGLSMATAGAGALNWMQTYLMTKVGYVALQSQLNPVAQQQAAAVTVVPEKETAAQMKKG